MSFFFSLFFLSSFLPSCLVPPQLQRECPRRSRHGHQSMPTRKVLARMCVCTAFDTIDFLYFCYINTGAGLIARAVRHISHNLWYGWRTGRCNSTIQRGACSSKASEARCKRCNWPVETHFNFTLLLTCSACILHSIGDAQDRLARPFDRPFHERRL